VTTAFPHLVARRGTREERIERERGERERGERERERERERKKRKGERVLETSVRENRRTRWGRKGDKGGDKTKRQDEEEEESENTRVRRDAGGRTGAGRRLRGRGGERGESLCGTRSQSVGYARRLGHDRQGQPLPASFICSDYRRTAPFTFIYLFINVPHGRPVNAPCVATRKGRRKEEHVVPMSCRTWRRRC